MKRKIFIPAGRSISPCKGKVFSLQVEKILLAGRKWVEQSKTGKTHYEIVLEETLKVYISRISVFTNI